MNDKVPLSAEEPAHLSGEYFCVLSPECAATGSHVRSGYTQCAQSRFIATEVRAVVIFWLCFAAITSVAGEDHLEPEAVWGGNTADILVATGSPGELGLLQALAEVFSANHDVAVGWVKAGSGESLQMLEEGAVDIALVHAPEGEKQAMAEGWVESRVLIGANEFYIVGPESDPAQISHVRSVVDAYQRIAAKGALIISRGDDSGTHRREMKIWKLAGVVPSGKWYRETHTFMLASLEEANEVAVIS